MVRYNIYIKGRLIYSAVMSKEMYKREQKTLESMCPTWIYEHQVEEIG